MKRIDCAVHSTIRAIAPTLQTLESRRFFSAGDLDVSFTGDGKAIIDLPGIGNEFANTTKVLDDGKILVAGRAVVGTETDFFVARLTEAGLLDLSFGGGDGVVTIDFADTDEAQDLAIDSSDRIVVVGTSDTGAGGSNARNFAVARLTPSGGFDNTFSIDGKTTVDFGSNDDAMSVAIDGSLIYVGGYKDLGASGHFALVRLTNAGAEDTSYSTDGEVFFGFGGNNDSRCYDIVVDASHRVFMVGYDRVSATTQRNFAYAMVGTNALIDPAFSGDGLAVTDFNFGNDEARTVDIDPQGRFVVGGTAEISIGSDFAATRITDTGSLDSSFNGDGRFVQSVGVSGDEVVNELAISPDGDITLAGATPLSNGAAVLIRLNYSNGNLSTTFGDGGDGIQTIDFGASVDAGFTVALDPRDLRAVLVGSDGAGRLAAARVHDLIDQNFANPHLNAQKVKRLPDGKLLVGSGRVSRLLADGTADPTFTSIFRVGVENDFEVDSQGRILTAGNMNVSGDIVCFVARNLPDGAPDTSFSGDGIMTFKFSISNNNDVQALTVDALDRIVVVGSTTFLDDSAIARITTSGVLDTSFNGDGTQIVVMGVDLPDFFSDVEIQSDGRIVALGEVQGSIIAGGASLVRFNSNGNLDPTFSVGGVTQFNGTNGRTMVTHDLVLDSSGRILVVAEAFEGIGSDTYGQLIRFTSSGSQDNSFGNGGKLSLRLGGTVNDENEDSRNATFDSAGNIYVSGTVWHKNGSTQENPRIIVRKLNPNGTAGVAGFGGDGAWVAPSHQSIGPSDGNLCTVLDEGSLMVGGQGGLFRLNVNPAIVDFEFKYETLPQQLVVKFNDDIGDTLIDADIIIRNTTTNSTVGISNFDVVSYNHLTNTAVVNFNGVLADGNYTATFSNTGIINRQNMQLSGDRVKDFFFLRGDANHDRTVNFDDLLIVSQNYGTFSKTFSQGNFDYDANGEVDFDDLLTLTQKYNTSVFAQSPIGSTSRRRNVLDLA